MVKLQVVDKRIVDAANKKKTALCLKKTFMADSHFFQSLFNEKLNHCCYSIKCSRQVKLAQTC